MCEQHIAYSCSSAELLLVMEYLKMYEYKLYGEITFTVRIILKPD